MSITNAVLENLPQNRDYSLKWKKTYIFLDSLLCNFVRLKPSDKLAAIWQYWPSLMHR